MRKIIEATVLALCAIAAILVMATPAKCQTNPCPCAIADCPPCDESSPYNATRAAESEEGIQTYTSNRFQVKATPLCGGSGCTYAIEVSRLDGKHEVLFRFLNLLSGITVLNETCVLIQSTKDFNGIDMLPELYGPSIGIVLCKEGKNFVEKTASFMGNFLRDQISGLEAWHDTLVDNPRVLKSLIIKAMAIKELFYREGLQPPKMPKMDADIAKLDSKTYKRIELEIIKRCNQRMLYRGLAN